MPPFCCYAFALTAVLLPRVPADSGEAEYTVIPPSPLFSRQSASPSDVYRPYFEGMGSALAPSSSSAHPPGGRSAKSNAASDKHSTASGNVLLRLAAAVVL